ncbi:predicted protein, partial [Nematostella vectensis]
MPVVGKYIPQCTPEGEYKQVQCYGSTGYCWCVDQMGSPVLGTIVRGVPQCNSSAVGGMTNCQTKRAAALQGSQGGLQPVGRFLPSCDVKGAYEKIQCWGSIGFCWCVDSSGNEIKGTRVRGTPSCDTTPAPTASGKHWAQSRGPLIGAYIPQCDKDGRYSALQCHGSTGYCWCVN